MITEKTELGQRSCLVAVVIMLPGHISKRVAQQNVTSELCKIVRYCEFEIDTFAHYCYFPVITFH